MTSKAGSAAARIRRKLVQITTLVFDNRTDDKPVCFLIVHGKVIERTRRPSHPTLAALYALLDAREVMAICADRGADLRKLVGQAADVYITIAPRRYCQ
jgi:hypothetical protein